MATQGLPYSTQQQIAHALQKDDQKPLIGKTQIKNSITKPNDMSLWRRIGAVKYLLIKNNNTKTNAPITRLTFLMGIYTAQSRC